MSVVELRFQRNVTFEGRNGIAQQGGVELFLNTGVNVLWLTPVTVKTGPAKSTHLEIPAEDLPRFINELCTVANLPRLAQPSDAAFAVVESRGDEVLGVTVFNDEKAADDHAVALAVENECSDNEMEVRDHLDHLGWHAEGDWRVGTVRVNHGK